MRRYCADRHGTARDDVCDVQPRQQSTPDRRSGGLPQCDPVLPQRRDLPNRKSAALAACNPETHAVSALKSVMFKGAHFSAISGDVMFLVVFTAIMLILAGATLKRSL